MQMKELEKTMKALANKRRLAILKFLKKRTQAPVAEIAEAINLSFEATSKHLGILFNAEILEREQISPQIYYRISDGVKPPIKSLLSML